MVSIVECVRRVGRAPVNGRTRGHPPRPGPEKIDAILASVRRYTIQCTEDGVTVGLVVRGEGDDRYGEATSEAGDLDAAVREALARATRRP